MATKNSILAMLFLRDKTEAEIKDATLWLEQAKDEFDWVLRLVLMYHPICKGLYEAKEEYQKIEQDLKGAYDNLKARATMHLEKEILDRGNAMSLLTYRTQRCSRYGYLTELSVVLEQIYGECLQSERVGATSTRQV